MKKTLIITALLSLGVHGVLGQGSINFNNRVLPVSNGGVNAPIYGQEPGFPSRELHGNASTNGGSTVYTAPLLSGTGFTIQLWGAPQGTPLAPLAGQTTTFRTPGPLNGYFVVPLTTAIVPGAAGGTSPVFDVRAWDNKGGTILTWAQVMADPTIPHGSTGNFNQAVQEPPVLPGNMPNMTSFNLFAVPEPSVIALGALGLGALLLRRRKA